MVCYKLIAAIAATTLFFISDQAVAEQWLEGRVTHVRDVDTIEVNNVPLRLNGLDGPELNERGGRAAKRWMQKLVLRKSVRCSLTGDKTYDRWVATCFARSGDDLAVLAISAGQARDCPRYSGGKYTKFETDESRALPSHSYCR